MTKGLAAGPYGDPARFDPSTTEDVPAYSADETIDADEAMSGQFARAISIYRASYTWISEVTGRQCSTVWLYERTHEPFVCNGVAPKEDDQASSFLAKSV